jgi:hypothetical protein
MKHLILAIVLVLCMSSAAAASDPTGFLDAYSVFYRGTSGEPVAVDASNPLPTSAVVTVGSVTVTAGVPPDVGSSTAYTTSAAAQAITSLANRQRIALFNVATETIWVSIGTTTAVVGAGVPVYAAGYYSDELDAAVPVGAISSTAATLNVVQTGY